MDPYLRALCYRPSRVGVESAWYGHVPFGYWLVSETLPREIVELGVAHGASYAAFCDGVVASAGPARCHGVDTWGSATDDLVRGNIAYDGLARFNDAHFAGFSTLLRMTFDEARTRFADGSVDLLHIDGHHTEDGVRHDFEGWLPKLSARGVVLIHATRPRHSRFGVWRFWEEARQRFPGFEFHHGEGLGVLAVGDDAPEAVRRLCTADAAAQAETRRVFAALGERWSLAHDLGRAEDRVIHQSKLAEDLLHVARRTRDRLQALGYIIEDQQAT
ncbi:class I SAM-dependent methyltransferase, partial [Acidisphaera rubrifaciens]|uniref:class I SAM-dependent methyltransferase n=1 Tax=Acidisphaera rubrifaciens TaxID=50715 RepID=UPI00066287A2